MNYTLNIKDVYLDRIKANKKHHEYRLNEPKRQKIQINDILTLQGETYSLQVEVTEIKVFSSWKEALTPYYLNDFDGVYNSLEETLKACNQFYSKEDVDKYGIVVFSIKKL